MTLASAADGLDASREPPCSGDSVAAALVDLGFDFDELLWLCGGALQALATLAAELADACPQQPTRAQLANQIAEAGRRYRRTSERLRWLRQDAAAHDPSAALVARLEEQKASVAGLLRSEQALLAALLGAADWQSPSFRHSVAPAAGRHVGRIRAHHNDYKRDRHLDADVYERDYIEALVDGPAELRALLTSCGMAAFTTVLSYLIYEGRLAGPVIAGSGIYHESRFLLERALPGRIEFVDESDTATLLRTVAERQPSAVFLDSLSNTALMPVPDLAAVIGLLRGSDTHLILDNTCLSVGCQAFELARGTVRLITFESLLKYAQLGLDRANAGVIVAPAVDAVLLDEYREHLGTNIADVAVHALPRPDRGVLKRRLARLERNALFLAGQLTERAPDGVAIVYPGRPGHPCAASAARLPFRGGCLSVMLHGADELARGAELVEAAVDRAAERGVQLIAGSSFGFDTTRIYLAAARAEHGRGFVRIAAGTENRVAIEALAEVLGDALALVS